MAQITYGLRAILARPAIYNIQQHLVGANQMRREIVEHYLRPWPGANLLDIGCGTGAILPHLPAVHYVGLDLSEDYVAIARAAYGSRATFRACSASQFEQQFDSRFDLILACGLLHHLEDEEAISLVAQARRLLAPNGRFVTVDGSWARGQSWFARLLLSYDRGRNVRDPDGYYRLARHSFEHVKIDIRHDVLWIPSTLCFLECS